ncbi:apoptosis facilitator Bcl-2-like protein 14 [Xenopus laevis]|uniref:apoptosis facilitator Bcl-2-like protein 14 n=1 Tax=Xenopus laevis TaxID=8355 RepID=A0A8J0TWL0_XENLA|nr:apoptosis facilitator Bcl-2-like protein 14 [Xenopus laevis]XP_041441844.1 apoptosis facilitator Bcl-2-like protein 14 [Xenopus laevis]OCT58190.1 hypothetical protein XELAEV_18002519mg [Xenopus laevis]
MSAEEGPEEMEEVDQTCLEYRILMKYTLHTRRKGRMLCCMGRGDQAKTTQTFNEDRLIRQLVEILKTSGDEINKRITQDPDLMLSMKADMTYSRFKETAERFLHDSVLPWDKEVEEQRRRLALCIHFTSQLSAVDNHPMNRVLGFGVKYLRENFSPWIQSQGGWDKALGIPDSMDNK